MQARIKNAVALPKDRRAIARQDTRRGDLILAVIARAASVVLQMQQGVRDLR